MGWKTSFPSFKHPLRYMNTVGWDSLSVFVASVQSCNNLLTSSLIRVKTLAKARLSWLGLLLTWRHPATTSVSRCSQKKKSICLKSQEAGSPLKATACEWAPPYLLDASAYSSLGRHTEYYVILFARGGKTGTPGHLFGSKATRGPLLLFNV
jgi:hypothetical protein